MIPSSCISEKVIYYKNAKEAIAAANPAMSRFLLQKGVNAKKYIDSFISIIDQSGFEGCKKISEKDNIKQLDNIKNKLTKENEYVVNLADYMLKCVKRGFVGEILFTQHIKKDKKIKDILPIFNDFK